jgi:hypothetical protein
MPSPSVITYQDLEDHANLHQRIADYYRKVAERLHTHGAPIVDDWRDCNPRNADSYEQWKSDFVRDANAMVDWHTQKHHDFLTMMDAWQRQEDALGGKQPSGGRFWRRSGRERME